MAICQPHNLRQPVATEKPYGIRVTLKSGTPFRRLMGDDWQKLYWYGSASERDAALYDMRTPPAVYRLGDVPDVVFEALGPGAPR